ncbi:class II aldolase/adducin family protein [Pseudomonas sp. B14-6]|jgi:ribulose-5-phosphate 4-epimerase/fuculose-1-phosphate aldolase|uniref:class II aldolase/adducin family protein n=1 Tax=Pseudomonas TaxID=286 RepID=UPI00155F24ED|nr:MULTISPECIES: class II aldolase/adducin family protein [Pseudomonas]MDI1330700.1 class II aldolase/adducin family protein [Pseudomonas sp.]MDO8707471.1 class II aldolase/adducin family protein [Pseudomonas sp.]QKG69191.1 class II aldolase/adducin family protein [Pseudomonas sp. B14-6]QZA99555.1 class II aldolase/adducin family protein [Pseudomonas mandelii]
MNEIAHPLRSTTEQHLREELAACYRLIAHFRMTDLIFTHISVRLPGPEHHFLINPYGLMFDEITASNLVKIGLDGRAVEPSPYPVNPAGFVIHSAIHGARDDAQCVLHTHTRSGCAVAALKCGLLPVNQISMEFYGRVAYHDYEGVALDMSEQQRLVKDLGDKPVLMLRNHGLLTVGQTVGQAFLRMYYLEKACEIQLAAQAAGELVLPPSEVCEHTERQFNDPGRPLDEGELSDPDAMQLAWAALLRLLERVAPGYRD